MKIIIKSVYTLAALALLITVIGLISIPLVELMGTLYGINTIVLSELSCQLALIGAASVYFIIPTVAIHFGIDGFSLYLLSALHILPATHFYGENQMTPIIAIGISLLVGLVIGILGRKIEIQSYWDKFFQPTTK